MKNIPDWFRVKKYIHFSSKIEERDFYKINNYVTNKKKVAEHAFFPLIHYEIVARKYKKQIDEKGEFILDENEHIVRLNNKSTKKIRKIDFANHLDAQIYSYYSLNIIGKQYEYKLKETNLDACVIGYRKIPSGRINKSTKKPINKCNIDFSHEIFQNIKLRKECVAITFDIKDFFPSLNHLKIKENWAKILDKNRLPNDHYTIFKSLTKFSFVNEKDIFTLLSIPHKNELKRKNYNSYLDSPREFRELIRKNNLINVNKNTEGIPQGTPLSALISNIYLFEFDKKVRQKVEVEHKGIYRRYSDDIMVVCDYQDYLKIEKYVTDVILLYNLEIHETKTKTHHFLQDKEKITVSEICKNGNIKHNIPLQYLGFDFYGSKTLLKSSSVAKYYRNMKSMINLKARRAGMYNPNKNTIHPKTKKSEDSKIERRSMVAQKSIYKGKGIFKEKIFLKYTHLGDSNFISYANRAAEIMNEPAIKKQISSHWQNVIDEINKYEYPVKYTKEKEKIDFDIF